MIRTALTLLVASVTAVAAAADAQPSPASARFIHESWTVRDGLPVNSITGLLQSRDGYIWIATFDGLVRFDGVRFTVFNAANSAGLPSNRIVSLGETRDGALWLITEQRQLVRMRDGVFTHFDAARGLGSRVNMWYEDGSGTLWVGTVRGAGAIRGDRFVPVAGGIEEPITALTGRADSSIWAGLTRGRLMRVAHDTARLVTNGSELNAADVASLAEDRDGSLWIAAGDGVWNWQAAPVRIARVQTLLTTLVPSRAPGEVWISGPLAVGRISRSAGSVFSHPGLFDQAGRMKFDTLGRAYYPLAESLYREGQLVYSLRDADPRATPTSGIIDILFDREGSVWLGTTASGLHRIKPATLEVYRRTDGLAALNVYSVMQDRSGVVWAGSASGDVMRIAESKVERFDMRRWSGTDTISSPQSRGGYWIRSLLHDRRDRLWIGSSQIALCDRKSFRCDRPRGVPGVRDRGSPLVMHEEPDGVVWVGADSGLYRVENDRWTRVSDGPSRAVRVIARAHDGALWMGTAGGGLSRWKDGRFRHLTTADSLPSNSIRSLYEDADGFLWIGTEGRGLARLNVAEWDSGKRGHIATISTADGLFDDVIHQILEDDFGRLWFNGNRGISWVERRQLDEFASGKLRAVNATSYTERDGMRNREGNGGSQPAGVKTRDGRLWFPTQDGVVVVDPATISRNRLPPPVVIEQVKSGGLTLPARSRGLSLTTQQRDLEIAYTGLSFLAPANVRFKYRLDPYDADWIDAGTRRTAFYTRVPPGHYTFRVIASNNDGVWNEQGAQLALELPPRLYETTVFRIAFAVAILGLSALIIRLRIQRLRARAVSLEGIVDARTRELRERNAQLAELHESRSRLFANLSIASSRQRTDRPASRLRALSFPT